MAYAIVSTEDATAKPRSNSPASTILVLGDSLSAGFGMNEGLSWVSLLQQRLHADDRDITVINASVSGETSAGGVRRLPALLEQWQPDLLLLELGGNDGLRGTNLKVIENNLATIIEQSHITGAIVVLLGMHIPPNYGPRYTAAFHQLYVTLAERYAISLVPFLLESVATKGELMQADGIHPVAKAQPIILDNVWPVLAEHLE